MKTVFQSLLRSDNLLDILANFGLQLLNRLVLALGDQLRHARRESEQFEKRLERREVPVLGPFIDKNFLFDARSIGMLFLPVK